MVSEAGTLCSARAFLRLMASTSARAAIAAMRNPTIAYGTMLSARQWAVTVFGPSILTVTSGEVVVESPLQWSKTYLPVTRRDHSWAAV
jgi:hypothetical protein